ncbi:kinase domain protein, partial [Fusobacterium sp. CM21]
LKHITIPNQKQYIDVLNSMGGDYSKADNYFAGVLKEIVNEIQIISTLSETGTRNIVRYYENDIVEHDSPKKYDIYILMECLTPFNDYFYNNKLEVKDVIKLGKDILTALVSCHEKNIIHRDIKDDNIFVSSDGIYKLGDFGVSKMLKDRSRAESMKGTPNFIAPEVYLGKEQYDNTVDIYSLGIVLYKLLNKSRNPFLPEFPQTYNSDDEDNAFEKRMKGESPPLPYDARNALGEVVVKAISSRNLRYDTAVEFLTAVVEAETKLNKDELETPVNQFRIESVYDGKSVS